MITADIVRIGLFALSGLLGMLFAYYRSWAWGDKTIDLWVYMFGDSHAVGRALTTLAAMCAGAGGLSYLDTLTTQQIVIAGLGIGLLVPENAKQ